MKLEAEDADIKITIQDNGKGMSSDVIQKIMNNIPVTKEKVDGHGIGFMQIREMLQRNQGTIKINSILGQGTNIVLKFPYRHHFGLLIKLYLVRKTLWLF